MPNLALWYARFDTEAFMAEYGASFDKTMRKRAERNIAKAQTKDSMKAFEKLTTMVDGEPRIISDPPFNCAD